MRQYTHESTRRSNDVYKAPAGKQGFYAGIILNASFVNSLLNIGLLLVRTFLHTRSGAFTTILEPL